MIQPLPVTIHDCLEILASVVIPEISAHTYIIIFLYLTTADKCFYFTSDGTKSQSSVLCSRLSQWFSAQYCSIQGDWVSGLTFLWIWCAFAANFYLSVFKCCLALLILSGKLEHKSSKSSFILMSQVLDLLKSEYWNGLELGMFKGASPPFCL